MEVLLAVALGVFFAISIYTVLRPNFLRVVIGFMMLSNAVNLMIFVVGRMTRGQPPLIPHAQKSLEGTYANPLPQALILTAIVISFALTAFALTLAFRAYRTLGTLNTNLMDNTELPPTTARSTRGRLSA